MDPKTRREQASVLKAQTPPPTSSHDEQLQLELTQLRAELAELRRRIDEMGDKFVTKRLTTGELTVRTFDEGPSVYLSADREMSCAYIAAGEADTSAVISLIAEPGRLGQPARASISVGSGDTYNRVAHVSTPPS
jgi:hypothetical protein